MTNPQGRAWRFFVIRNRKARAGVSIKTVKEKISKMGKKYMRVQKNFNKNGISRVPHSVSQNFERLTGK